jgi:acyl carrier protein
VQSCAVIVREDEPGNRQLVGYAVPRKPRALDAAGLQAHLAERLPDYMVPAHLVLLEHLPLTQNGKVDRKALPAPKAAEGVAARTPTESRLAAIWAALLGIEAVGIDQDVFDLGAHSLLAVRAVAQMREEFAVDVQLRNIFERPTVAELAALIDGLSWLGQRPARAEEGEREQIAL